jgi:hypothetical protein
MTKAKKITAAATSKPVAIFFLSKEASIAGPRS